MHCLVFLLSTFVLMQPLAPSTFCHVMTGYSQHVLSCCKKNWSEEVIKHLEMCFLKGDMQRFFTKLMKSSF